MFYLRKDGTYIISLGEYRLIGTDWLVLYPNGKHVTYFESFGVEDILKKIKRTIENKNITTIPRYFYFEFLIYVKRFNSLIDYNNLFFPN